MLYAVTCEPGWLELEHVAVPIRGLPSALEGLKIAHLSDLHFGPYTGKERVRAAVEAALALDADLVLVTGDYVLRSEEYAEPCARELVALQAPLGVYAVPGNHDYWTNIDEVAAQISGAGLRLLRNSSKLLTIGGAPLWIVGVDDVWEGHHDLDRALADVPLDEPVLLLVHEPDFADRVAQVAHWVLLQLSGHSHGGQVNLPLLGRPALPWLGRKYPVGLQSVVGSELQVYTNRGVGLIAPPVRFNCRPEVTLLTLKSAQVSSS